MDRRCKDSTPALAEAGRDYVEYEQEIETLWVRSGTQWSRETEEHEHTACSSARLTNFVSLACCGVLCFMTSVRWTCVATHGAHPGFCVGVHAFFHTLRFPDLQKCLINSEKKTNVGELSDHCEHCLRPLWENVRRNIEVLECRPECSGTTWRVSLLK